VVRSVLAEVATRRLKDPRLTATIFSFTEVAVAPDLSYARIGVSVMGEDEQKREVIQILTRSSSFLQRELNKEIRMRRIPTLAFYLDESIEQGDKMTQLLRDVARSEGRDL